MFFGLTKKVTIILSLFGTVYEETQHEPSRVKQTNCKVSKTIVIVIKNVIYYPDQPSHFPYIFICLFGRVLKRNSPRVPYTLEPPLTV